MTASLVANSAMEITEARGTKVPKLPFEPLPAFGLELGSLCRKCFAKVGVRLARAFACDEMVTDLG